MGPVTWWSRAYGKPDGRLGFVRRWGFALRRRICYGWWGPASRARSGQGVRLPKTTVRRLTPEAETSIRNPSLRSNQSRRAQRSPVGVAVSAEVEAALASGGAVVALESTIISHGMPYPKNLQTAMEVEAIVRENGAVPATIAILHGVPHVGLNSQQLKRLAISGTQFQKTARRDIAQVVASGGNGATTVSATMFFAHKVGIPIFVTGGIGGMHRHGEKTMDISSDLTELGKTPVAVISAGVKSILDISRTLEYLETQGVTVAAYQTNEFPAFFTDTSGCKAPCRVDSPEECAKIIDANKNMHLESGILIAVPIPKQHAASGKIIESAIQQALKEADDKKITGNAITPFILDRVKVLTGGSSLEANIALVKNNALTGARIAVALSDLRKRATKRSVRSAL